LIPALRCPALRLKGALAPFDSSAD
jgi:hypothetical protein